MKRDRVLDIEVDDQNWLGRTALHEGILHNREDVVQHLVKIECASARIADKEGNTALHFAVEGGYLRMVRLLLEVDADVSADNLDIEPRSPLQLARRKFRKVELEKGRINAISTATQPSTSTSGAKMIHWLLTHRPFLLPPEAPHFFENVRHPPLDISPAAVKACKLHVITAVEFFQDKKTVIGRRSVFDMLYHSKSSKAFSPIATLRKALQMALESEEMSPSTEISDPQTMTEPAGAPESLCRWFHLPANNVRKYLLPHANS